MSILRELSLFAKNYTILIVEDQKELNEELVEICQLFFKSVDNAYDGEEALNKFKNNPNSYDIILSDITMPNMNGVILSREIKTIERLQNIVILSAHSEVQYLVDLIDIGINQFISKPFEQNELLFRLLKVCENIFYKNEYIKMVKTKQKQILKLNSVNNKKIIENAQVNKSNINEVIHHERISANNFLESMQDDDYVWTVMESQIEELLFLVEELKEEIEKIHLNYISKNLILNISSILRKISSILSFVDELSKLSKVIFNLVIFLESLNIEIIPIEKRNKLKILEFINDDISRFVETVFIYKDTLDISYLEDSLNSSIEQLKMNLLDEKFIEEELDLF